MDLRLISPDHFSTQFLNLIICIFIFLELLVSSRNPAMSDGGSLDDRIPNNTPVASERRSLFDGLVEPLCLSDEHQSSTEDQAKSENLSRLTSNDMVVAGAPELSAPSSVICTSPSSPPPDLGLPMMSEGKVSPNH